MSQDSLEQWRHDHDFVVRMESGERRTRQVILLTAVTMVVEIIAGSVYGSMALLADGWHMGTHVAAFGITLFAYGYARRHAANRKYSFGTGKVSVLGGFASAVALALVALMMVMESVERLLDARTIHFDEAIAVAILGLLVNLLSAYLLHDHGHSHDHKVGHQHDHNLRAAYLHVLADALTSVLAIIALVSGKFLGWTWMDAAMGIVGALVIMRWSYGLIKETSVILLDGNSHTSVEEKIHQAIESGVDDRITDLHIWDVGPHHTAAIVSVLTSTPEKPAYYKDRIRGVVELSHLTVEVNSPDML